MTERQNMRELARKAKQRMIAGYYGKGEQRGRRRTLEDKVMHDTRSSRSSSRTVR